MTKRSTTSYLLAFKVLPINFIFFKQIQGENLKEKERVYVCVRLYFVFLLCFMVHFIHILMQCHAAVSFIIVDLGSYSEVLN